MNDWLPIETAPRDGTAILVWAADKPWWNEPFTVRWHEPWGKWVVSCVLLDLGDWEDPTHWMPLPAAPVIG